MAVGESSPTLNVCASAPVGHAECWGRVSDAVTVHRCQRVAEVSESSRPNDEGPSGL